MLTQEILPTYCSDALKDHRFIQCPFCSSCDRRFSEEEFLALLPTGFNIVWDIEYAACPDCTGEVQGWRRVVQGWRG